MNLKDCLPAVSGGKSNGDRPLPLFHSTSQLNLEKILLGDKMLQSKYCDILKKSVVFFFYGRLAYRVSKNSAGFPGHGLAHCAFIFDPSIVNERIATIHPFDTGAFALYSPILQNNYSINDFNLGTDIKTCLTIVDTYWKNKRAYYDFDTKKINLRYVAKQSDSLNQSYIDLLSGKAISGIDERRGTIEVTASDINPIELKAKDIIGIVCPCSLMENSVIREMSEQNKDMIIKTYFYNGAPPIQYQKLIESIAFGILRNKGFI